MENKEIIESFNKKDEYSIKKNLVLKMFHDFMYLSTKQIRIICDNVEYAARIITELKEAQVIFFLIPGENSSSCDATYTIDTRLRNNEIRNQFKKRNNALWVYLDLLCQEELNVGSYVIPENKIIDLTFEMNDELYDVISIKNGKEAVKTQLLHAAERYLPDTDKKHLNRMIIIENEAQIKKIEEYGGIIGTIGYITIDEYGNSQYFD